MSDIKKIKEEFFSKLSSKISLAEVNQIKSDLFGKNGIISIEFKKIGQINESERKKFASDLNEIKDELQTAISKKIQDLEIFDPKLFSRFEKGKYISNLRSYKI